MMGLMSGYVNGRFSNNTTDWFMLNGTLPALYPFSGARPSPDDGFYYHWAAIVYNLSDAYGHPYSDRSGRPNPTLSFPFSDILRVTFMADQLLDAPMVTATTSDSSITLHMCQTGQVM